MAAALVALVPAAHAGDLRNFDDAALHAVQFIDQYEGWAVGDEGVVWHTIDGGHTWERQPTHVRASLRSLYFHNGLQGWAVGREELPGGGSVGVLLFTEDNGVTWHRLLANALPGLNRVRFLNARDGFVIGDGSEQYPSGIFRTADGGRSWKPVKGRRSPSWLAADFQDAQTGALAGSWSRLAKMRQGNVGTAEVESLGSRTLHGLQIVRNRAIAVGQGGAVLVSRTSGARWGYADLKLPRDVLACLDFHGLCCTEDHAWVVGRPGSVVLHSPDLGDTWELLPTRQPVPLNGVFFLNESRGWAVGEMGSILATSDGGKSWTVQHRGCTPPAGLARGGKPANGWQGANQRAAVLFVHALPGGLPADTVALLGGDEGYLAVALRVAGPDPGSAAPSQAAEGPRFAAAVRLAGGMAGEMLWQFPLPQHAAHLGKEELMQGWNRLHGSRADRELLRQLVLALRIWRPDVVITDHPKGPACGALVAEALDEALRLAADAGAFPEQVQRLGLAPWKVSKAYCLWEPRRAAEVTLDLTEVRPRLEASARDFAAPAASLLGENNTSLPGQRDYHLLSSRLAGAVAHRSLMGGIDLAPGKEARRELPAAADLKPEIVKALRARRSFELLTDGASAGLVDPTKTLAQIGPTLAALPDDQAAAAAYAVASHYARQGQWVLAREAFLLLVDRYPSHPRAVDAYRWLMCHSGSSEARRRQELGQFLLVSQEAFGQTPITWTKGASGAGRGKAAPPVPHGGAEVKADTRLVLLGNQAETRQWFRGTVEAGKRLAAFGPLYATDPAMQFCVQAAHRQLGEVAYAEKWYTHFLEKAPEGPWREAAAAELWLSTRAGLPPRPVLPCVRTGSRPFLDGQFDDPCWRDHRPTTLNKVAGLPFSARASKKELEGHENQFLKEYVTEVRLTYDDEFLYLALRCRHPADRYVPPVKVRKRDADLRPYDRVSLLLDLDRDYSTYFHLQVDQRGCVFEDCWGDAGWNPRWFVAIRSEKTGWQVEAAIPLIELTGDRVPVGSAWACNVVRILPGRGVQALSLPADVEPRPEGMGLLLFQQNPNQVTPAKQMSSAAMPKVQ
jgi:photosystem II stability/assembly factor-like uncharacterized protein